MPDARHWKMTGLCLVLAQRVLPLLRKVLSRISQVLQFLCSEMFSGVALTCTCLLFLQLHTSVWCSPVDPPPYWFLPALPWSQSARKLVVALQLWVSGVCWAVSTLSSSSQQLLSDSWVLQSSVLSVCGVGMLAHLQNYCKGWQHFLGLAGGMHLPTDRKVCRRHLSWREAQGQRPSDRWALFGMVVSWTSYLWQWNFN